MYRHCLPLYTMPKRWTSSELWKKRVGVLVRDSLPAVMTRTWTFLPINPHSFSSYIMRASAADVCMGIAIWHARYYILYILAFAIGLSSLSKMSDSLMGGPARRESDRNEYWAKVCPWGTNPPKPEPCSDGEERMPGMQIDSNGFVRYVIWSKCMPKNWSLTAIDLGNDN